MSKTKVCRNCQAEKPASEFYKDRKNKTDGLSSYCKTCKRQRWREWYHEGGKESVSQYKQSEDGREVHRRANRRYQETARGKQAIHRTQKKRRQLHPERIKFYNTVHKAIRQGDLSTAAEQKCVDCGNQAAHYHHEDYSAPLDVTPLCECCHRKRHS